MRFSILFALFLSFSAAAENLDRVVAVVGPEAILESDVKNRLADFEKSSGLASIYRLQPADVKFPKVQELLIEEKIIESSVKDMGITVTDGEVESQIQAVQKQHGLTREQLKESLRREGIEFELYKRNIRLQILRRSIFDRELRKGGGVSEAELRQHYERSASQEFEIVLFTAPNRMKLELQTSVKNLREGTTTLEEALSKNTGESLGWVGSDSLDPKIVSTLKTGKDDKLKVSDVIESPKNSQFVVVKSERRGSEEGFQKSRAELMMTLQGQDYERRFTSWIERRKSEMQILVNK